MRGDQLSRQWRILRQLAVSKAGLMVGQIAGEGEVSLRTAYRDVADLQLAGFPITTEKEGKATRWRFIEGYQFKIPEPFTLTELLWLHLGLCFHGEPHPGFQSLECVASDPHQSPIWFKASLPMLPTVPLAHLSPGNSSVPWRLQLFVSQIRWFL